MNEKNRIFELLKEGHSYTKISKELGLSRQYVGQIVSKESLRNNVIILLKAFLRESSKISLSETEFNAIDSIMEKLKIKESDLNV